MRHFIKAIGNINILCVRHTHGERFIQACLDGGNALATARKKTTALKRLFQLAVERGQLVENPLKEVREPKIPNERYTLQ
jgi:site-specific recombinase XerD